MDEDGDRRDGEERLCHVAGVLEERDDGLELAERAAEHPEGGEDQRDDRRGDVVCGGAAERLVEEVAVGGECEADAVAECGADRVGQRVREVLRVGEGDGEQDEVGDDEGRAGESSCGGTQGRSPGGLV